MASNYPASLDTTATLPAAAGVGANLSTFPHSALHGNADDAIIAIETELGVAPSDTFSTVKARLDFMALKIPTIYNVTAIAATTAGTGVLVVATLNIPAQANAGKLLMGGQLYRTQTSNADQFETSIWNPGGVMVGASRNVIAGPATPDYSSFVMAAGMTLAAATSAAYTMRLTRTVGAGTSTSVADANYSRLWAVFIPD